MSRKIIVLFCSVNALIGIGILWYVLAPRLVPDERRVEAAPKQDAPKYSDEELWQKAVGAANAREAFGYLARTGKTRDILEKSARQIDALAKTEAPAFERWPFFEALLRFFGSRAESPADLQPLMRLAVQPGQALTLRDAAFRSYIDNFGRLKPVDTGAGYALIDTLYGEGNGLTATALQAEHLLREQGILRAAAIDPAGAGSLRGAGVVDPAGAGSLRGAGGAGSLRGAAIDPAGAGSLRAGGSRQATEPILLRRARGVLLDPAAIETNRLAAASILLRLGEHPEPGEIRAAWGSTDSERLHVKLLQLIGASGLSDEDRAWLKDVRAATPEVERLVRSILEN